MNKITVLAALTACLSLGFTGRLLAQTDGSVSFQVTTLRTFVDRDPNNIMAIWVTDGQGAFVKTLKKRAVEQEAFLYQWIASSKKNVADAITGATLSTQQTHQVTWNCRNAAGALVTNGVYRIMVEMTTQNSQGPVTPASHIQFTKGPSGATVIPANLTYFSGMSLVYTPLVIHDVAVSSLTPTTGVAGATIPITIAVTNLQPTTESFTVVLSNQTSGVLIGSAAVASLGPQKGTNVTINWNTVILAAGGYSLKAAASAVAGETNLANNVRTTAFTLNPPIPDIAVTALAPASGIAGDTIPVTVSITNRQKTTESFSVVLSNQTSGVLIGSAAVASLGPQKGTNVAISWNTAAVTPGGYSLLAVAGPVATETNLANNTLTAAFTLNATIPIPDIAVTAISPSTGVAGGTIPVHISVTNHQPTTESFTVVLSNQTSGVLIRSVAIPSLGPLAGTVVTLDWNTAALPAGGYTLKATAGPVAGETNLANNALTAGLGLSEPLPVSDVAVTAITPTSGTAGDTLSFSIGVTNRQPTTVSFTVVLSNQTSGVLIGSVEVAALGANAGTNVTIGWNTAGLIPGDYTLDASAGPVAGETNLADNALSAVISLSAPPLVPDIAVTAISPGTGVMGDTIPVEITLANQQPTTEAFSLVLSNATSGVLIGSSSIPALGPNASAVITINWNTAGLPAGDYSLRATASPVPGETSLADNTRTSVLSLTLPPGGPQQDGSVSFRVTTLRTYQGIDPINVMAIWVTDSKGRFVRTLKKQAAHREPFLLKWIASSKHNTVDAITGATLTTHLAHKVTWNCRDAAGKLVSNGVYRIMVEMTTQDGQGPVTPATHIKFTKGPKAVTVTPGNLPFFSGMALTYTPVNGRDIAVTGIRPGSGVAGTTVPIVVTVTNLLKTTESFKVMLSDHATGLPLDSVTVPELGPKAGKVVTLPWRTTGLATGHHLLDVAAVPVPGETNVANNVMTTDLNLVAPAVVPNDGIVRFSVTTLRTYRDFDPKNIMAIWVADANGFFVKTLKKQAGQQEGYLLTWLASSKSDVTDAITGATLNAHKTHKVTWNCRDTSGLVVPNGTYRIMVEMTTGDGQGPITPAGHIKFLKGKKAVTVTPANLPNFSGMSLTFTPAKAAAFAAAAPPERASAATTTRAAAPVLAVAAPPVTTAVVAAANGVLVTGKGSTLIVQQADADGAFQTAGIIDLPGAIQGVAASGTTVVTANGAEGVFIVDITNPSEPALAGAYPTEGPAVAVALDGTTLYVADEIAGLIAVDIADPAEPVRLGVVE